MKQKGGEAINPVKRTKKTDANDSGSHPRSTLSEAYLVAGRASRLGFDWPDMTGVMEKLTEEMDELREALALGDRKKAEEEFGDLLFVMVNVARFLKIHPEKALAKTIKKFESRFRYVEEALRKKGKSLQQSNLAEMEDLWQEAKRLDKSKGRRSQQAAI
jgi:uncharacterized protein YabN with tetrapyrrole methylase and pyrophosphatase domain